MARQTLNLLFQAPYEQTCEVRNYGKFLRTEQRPVPLVISEDEYSTSVYAPNATSQRMFLLEGNIKLWKFENSIVEEHPNGQVYYWYNPVHIMKHLANNRDEGCYIRKNKDESWEGRLEGRPFTWSTPTIRQLIPLEIIDEFKLVEYLQEKEKWLIHSIHNYKIINEDDLVASLTRMDIDKEVYENRNKNRRRVGSNKSLDRNMEDYYKWN